MTGDLPTPRYQIPFLKIIPVGAAISALAVLGSLILLTTKGLHYGIDFRGGTEAQILTTKKRAIVIDTLRQFSQTSDVSALRVPATVSNTVLTFTLQRKGNFEKYLFSRDGRGLKPSDATRLESLLRAHIDFGEGLIDYKGGDFAVSWNVGAPVDQTALLRNTLEPLSPGKIQIQSFGDAGVESGQASTEYLVRLDTTTTLDSNRLSAIEDRLVTYPGWSLVTVWYHDPKTSTTTLTHRAGNDAEGFVKSAVANLSDIDLTIRAPDNHHLVLQGELSNQQQTIVRETIFNDGRFGQPVVLSDVDPEASNIVLSLPNGRPGSVKQMTDIFSEDEFGPIASHLQGEAVWLIQFETISQLISRLLDSAVGQNSVEIQRVDAVGPTVGTRLKEESLAMILVSILLIMVYVWFRFDARFAPGAVIALVHDVVVTLGLFVITGKEISVSIVAALLTIIGYSLNDTIVIYDRIRENLIKYRSVGLREITALSMNQTLSRTILTSLTTFLSVMALFLFGGGIIHDFAFAMAVGIIAGTYSTIFVATPFVFLIEDVYRRRGLLNKRNSG